MDAKDKESDLVVVAIATCRRPRLLSALLDRLDCCCLPEQAAVRVLVVDNDPSASAEAVVSSTSARLSVSYCHEPRRGIPIARNRALAEAFAMDADALCFVDDDELPDEHWIVELVRAWRGSGACLLGGPVQVMAASERCSAWQRIVNASLVARAERKNRITASRAARGKRYTIVTNNWLADLRWLHKSGLRFDENLLFTGGSDTAFCRAAISSGCKLGWAPRAVVREIVLPDRLSLAYQFKRAKDQSATNFHLKYPMPGIAIRGAAIVSAFVKAVAGIALLVAPIFGRASLVIGIRSVGWAAGRLMACAGRRSRLYE